MKTSVSKPCSKNSVPSSCLDLIMFFEKVNSIIECVIYLYLISKQGKGRDTMAPHPVVQAIIDLSAGAVGKLQYLHF